MRVLTLRSPLYVKGTFKHPDAGVKAGPLIARARRRWRWGRC